MENIRLEILGLSSSQSQAGSFALVLGEVSGKRRLPIIIGMFEAQAIAIEIEKIAPNRPMTHDLFKEFAEHFNFKVEKILISDLKEGVFFAKIVCTDGEKIIEVDARPSDAIAIGLRFGVDIFTNETIMSEAGIIFTDEEGDAEENEANEEESTEEDVEGVFSTDSSSELAKPPKAELEKMMQEAIAKEDYEKAARIRDELEKR